jgi:predicted O-linked N-acetylglucosamine transferase (SPINDLY family)
VLGRLLPEGPVRPIEDPDPERRLRVGLLSADFRRHSVAFFLEPLLEHLDRDRFHVICYHTILNEDDMTARFQALASEWRTWRRVPLRTPRLRWFRIASTS